MIAAPTTTTTTTSCVNIFYASMIPISLNATVSGLIVFSFLVRMLIWLYGSGRLAFSVGRERERVIFIALHQLVLVS